MFFRRRSSIAALGVVVAIAASAAAAAPASAYSVTPVASYTDPRGDAPDRPGHRWVRALYGPHTLPPSSEIHNDFWLSAPPPCQGCYITDMVVNLVDAGTGATVNLDQDVMLHHMVLIDRSRQDVTCPSGTLGQYGMRFFAAGNERTHLHLPKPYAFRSDTANYVYVFHLVNKSPTETKSVNVEIMFRHYHLGVPATPLWLDIDGCGDSEYTAPVGYSDVHSSWTSNINGRFLALGGHLHDVDITNLQRCTNSSDDDADGRVNDGCPALGAAETVCTGAADDDGDGRVNDGCAAVGAVEGPCLNHCAAKGHGIAVSAEIRNGFSGDYYGPIPPNRAPPADLTGATVCRSQGYYGTPSLGGQWRGHLDTMSLCGVFHEIPAGHQAEPYPPDGEFPIDGYPLKQGDVVRLHSEYQNDTGTPQPDVMGIMIAWVAPEQPGYARPVSASPVSVRFVPAYTACSSANAAHGPPRTNGSCSPATPSSGYLTVGSPESNGLPANSTGHAALKVLGESPIDPANGDQADVQVTGQVTDVRRKANPTQTYTGQLRLTSTVRITDRFNVTDQATAQDVPFNLTAACTSGTCNLATTFDAAMPNVIREGKRAIWELGQMKLFDGGADGLVSTADNTLFAVQGVFAP